MRPFVKIVDPSIIENEVELQRVAIMYGYSPQIISVTSDEIYMEDLEAPCLADIYGEEASRYSRMDLGIDSDNVSYFVPI